MSAGGVDPGLLGEMDFSFSCDRCSFSTKDIMEIKLHILSHRNQGKDPSQTVSAAGSSNTQQNETNRDTAADVQTSHNSAQDSSNKDQLQDSATPDNKDTPSDTWAGKDAPIEKATPTNSDTPLMRDSPASPPCTQQNPSDDGSVPSMSELRDDGDCGKTMQEEAPKVVAIAENAPSTRRETTVIVTNREQLQKPGGTSTQEQQQQDDIIDMNTQASDTIADRIHSRRRPTARKPQAESDDDDDEYIPYKPAKRGSSRMKRQVRRRIPGSSLPNLKGKVKARPVIASDRFKCQHCHFACKFKQNLNAHVRGSHPEVYAKMIQDRRQEQEEEEEEDRGVSEGDQQPGNIVDEIQSHVAPDRYKCTLCDTFSCRFKKDLHDHKSRVHGVASPVYKYQSRIPENRYQCPECDYVCKFQRSLRLHCRAVHPKVVKSPEVKVKKEKKVAENRYQCTECDFTCKFKGQLKNHKSNAHKKERPPKMVREQQCEFCNKFIQGTTHHYRRHLKTHTGDKPYKCTICDAVFGDQSRLNAHAPIHQEERNYLCDQCGKSFKRAINLRMHRKVHLVVRPHGCELCNYRCKRHDTLNLHMKRKHLKIRRILCATCGKKFFSEKECQLHAARKHLPRPTPFQCTFCPMAFPFPYNLRAHMKKHPEHKPFRCDFCTFESRSKASLQDHEKMHTGEKQKKCELCDYTTSTSSNLYKHRKRQHGIVNSTRSKSPRIRSPPLERHPSLPQSVILQGSPHGSLPTTPLPTTPQPHPMMPANDGQHAHHMHMQNRLQGSPSPIPGQIQGSASPSLTPSITQSVTIATSSGHVDLRNAQGYEDIEFKDRRTIIYGREKSLIGSVITEALAEARNVVQSELYSGHMIPSTMAPAGLHHTALPSTTTIAPHGGIVSAETIIHGGIPTNVTMSSGIPQSGASGIFNSIMNIHY